MTPSVEEQLLALDALTLTPIVRTILQDNDAEVVDWTFSRLPGDNINPVTAGLYRFSGTARYHTTTVPWSMVLKVSQWVDFSGTPLGIDYLTNPWDWNYWKREALVYRSHILENWHDDLKPIRCFAVFEPSDTIVWMWLEEAIEPNRAMWPLERHLLAANHFGKFNGAHAGYSPSRSDVPWLCRHFIRQWMNSLVRLGLKEIADNTDFWKHRYTQAAFPPGTNHRLQQLLADAESFCDLLDEQPQTLSHQDTHWPNLFSTRDAQGNEQTLVIDWSFLGLAAIGEDLGTQISGNVANSLIDPAQVKTYYEAAFDAYVEGLQQAGWRRENKSVRFSCAVAASLRYATFEVMLLNWLIGDKEEGKSTWIDHLAQKQNVTIEESLKHWGTGILFLFDLADEARDLATQL